MMWKDVLKRDKVLAGLFKFIYTVLSAALPLVLFTMPYKVVLTFEARWMKSLSVTIQMKGSIEQFFHVVVFIMLYKVVVTFETSLWMKSYGVTIQIKATEQFFLLVLFTTLYKVVLTFVYVDEIQSAITCRI